ncbi:AraC family transcriptional regulator [Photobacterium sp. SDRW27]|uniref:AraC family transcriptional regulator n=1 Tax=Photobacterium obscurum TaxID=2829490 RepID=UPI00224416EB|nr:AraC family transcriptional regulator [Photobacterium obscurum]MCW8329143.1 AraC family transcriptional regulator [Photobacterium obscurum]
MINTIPFDNENYVQGIRADSVKYLLARRGSEELANPHRVDFYALILVTEGSGFHYIDNKMYHCRPGTLFVLSPQQVHYFESKFQWNGYVVTFEDSQVFPIDNLDANYAMTKAIRSVDVMTEVLDVVGKDFDSLYEEFHQPVDIASGHIQRNLLQNILFKIFFRTNYSLQKISKSKEMEDFQLFSDEVERAYMTKHNVSEYTEKLRMTAKRLNTICKKVKGMSAKQVVDARLLLEAKRLLGYTSTPISEVALILGFNEPTNLAKFFRRHTDISPTEFRNMSKFFADNN